MITHPTQTRLLAEIARQEIEQTPLTIAAMAEALGLDDSNTSRTLKRMAQDGWITRDPLALTDAGRSVLAAAPPVLIPHSQIDPSPRNPRQMNLAEGSPQLEELRQLAESIADKGQLQPILVRPVKNGVYEIVGGERRWRAMVLLIMEDRLPEDHPVAASIRPLSDEDAMVLALAENMARRDMNPMDEAEGLFSVYGPRVGAAGEGERRSAQAETVERLARATGQSVRYIQARIRLARDLTESVRTMVRLGELSVAFANELVSWPEKDQPSAAGKIAARAEGWQTVEQVRARRKGAADSEPPPNAAPETADPETAKPEAPLPDEAIRTAEALALAEAEESSARHALKQNDGDASPAPAATNTGTPAPAPEGWPRDANASTLTDRALIHALAHALSGGAMRITIDADPLAQPVAAELMARIAGVPEYDGITVKAGGNRAIVSGRR
jgi:ParB family chromosome partitioning protein